MITDIIIPVWNNLRLTKQCVKTIKAFTWGIDYRILIINDGSTDNTENWLEAIHKLQVPLIDHITLPANTGFNHAVNEGLRNIRDNAQYVVIMNNDIQVRDNDWLISLILLARNYGRVGQKVGAVVPTTTDFSSRQSVLYNDGKWYEEVGYVPMSCMLLPVKVVKEIGYLDESLDPNCQADLDYCIRLVDAGYKIIVNRKILVNHEKNATTKIHPLFQSKEYHDRNYDKMTNLVEKWGKERVRQLFCYQRFRLSDK